MRFALSYLRPFRALSTNSSCLPILGRSMPLLDSHKNWKEMKDSIDPYQSDNPRWKLREDGTRVGLSLQGRLEDHHDSAPNPIHIIEERGQKWVLPQPRMTEEHITGMSQNDLPFYPRKKMLTYGDYPKVLRLEWTYFHVPTLLLLGLIVPMAAALYAITEIVNSTMTVKVTGRQWYWVYDVEVPKLEDE